MYEITLQIIMEIPDNNNKKKKIDPDESKK